MKIAHVFKILIVLILAISVAYAQNKPEAFKTNKVKSLQVTILSTMVADSGIGEWGFAALVEADGHKILFDTGARDDTVLQNAQELKLDLGEVEDLILSHNHSDHTGGLLKLRRTFMKTNRKSLTRAHVGKGIFWSRPLKSGGEGNDMLDLQPKYKALGGKFIEHAEPEELFPGVWLTGSIPRVYPEKNWSGSNKVQTTEGLAEDNLPEEISLVINTDKGLVVISGCGHAGIINTLEYARKQTNNTPIYAALGGFHLFEAENKDLDWTASKLKEFGTQNLVGAHCTGFEAVYRIREHAGLNRQTCVVGSVGASFSLDKGIDPLDIAK